MRALRSCSAACVRQARTPIAKNTARKMRSATSVSPVGPSADISSDMRMSLASCGFSRLRLLLLDVGAKTLQVRDHRDRLAIRHARRTALRRELAGDLLGLRARHTRRVVER